VLGMTLSILFILVDKVVRKFYLLLAEKKIVVFLGSIWYLPSLSSIYPAKSLILGGNLIKYTDQGWYENLGGQGLSEKFLYTAGGLDK